MTVSENYYKQIHPHYVHVMKQSTVFLLKQGETCVSTSVSKMSWKNWTARERAYIFRYNCGRGLMTFLSGRHRRDARLAGSVCGGFGTGVERETPIDNSVSVTDNYD